jgi:hypothetical protein
MGPAAENMNAKPVRCCAISMCPVNGPVTSLELESKGAVACSLKHALIPGTGVLSIR